MVWHLIIKCHKIRDLMTLCTYIKRFNRVYRYIYLYLPFSLLFLKVIYMPLIPLNDLIAPIHGHKISILMKFNDLIEKGVDK